MVDHPVRGPAARRETGREPRPRPGPWRARGAPDPAQGRDHLAGGGRPLDRVLFPPPGGFLQLPRRAQMKSGGPVRPPLLSQSPNGPGGFLPPLLPKTRASAQGLSSVQGPRPLAKTISFGPPRLTDRLL